MKKSNRKPETLIDLLVFRAEAYPNRRAYTFLADGETEGDVLSYGELEQRARSIAAYLQAVVRPGERALLLYPPGLDYITTFFACMYAGVIAVPCYPPRRNRPDPRLLAISTDSGARIVLTTLQLFRQKEALSSHFEVLQELSWVPTDAHDIAHADVLHIPAINRNSLAFLQYTSGSTGSPKGVMVSHGNLLHNAGFIQHKGRFTQDSIGLCWLPVFHDLGMMSGIIEPLFGGFVGMLMPPQAFLQKPVRWLNAISRYRVTASGGPNFAYEQCLKYIRPEHCKELDLNSWTVAYNGAETIRHDTMVLFSRRFKPYGFRSRAFIPSYGLAEHTVGVVGCREQDEPASCTLDTEALKQGYVVDGNPSEDNAKTLVGCGFVELGTVVRIVDPDTFFPSPPDVVGEIWVSGPSVTQGYWNRPDDTANTFQTHLADTGEGPFLRTGDLGFLKDGELYVTGRIKELIIIRGANYYPSDVEYIVEQCHSDLNPGSGAAFSIERQKEERLVIAHEVKRTALRQLDADAVIEAIRRAISERLDIQVEAVVLLKTASLPKTSSGKVQRRLCREKYLNNSLNTVAEWQRNPVKPGQALSSTDPVLSSIRIDLSDHGPDSQSIQTWFLNRVADMVGIEKAAIDIERPLVSYGVDSIMALSLSGELSEQLNRPLSLTLVYDFSTIKALSDHIVADICNESPGLTEVALATKSSDKGEEYPFALSYGQQALWMFQQEHPQSTAYNVGVSVRIKSALDLHELNRCLRTVIIRHPILRCVFMQIDGRPVHTIKDNPDISIKHVDASNLTDNQVRQKAHQILHHPFNLCQGPLLRAYVLTIAEKEFVLLLSIHHIVTDGWSLEILLDELLTLYEAHLRGSRTGLPEIRYSYRNFVDWQSGMIESERGDRHRRYWERRLSGDLPVLRLPTDRPYPVQRSYQGASYRFTISEELAGQLKTLAHKTGTTLYMVLLAAFQVFLHRYSGQNEIVIGSPVAGRSRKEFDEVNGFFVNMLPVRSTMEGDPTFSDFLARIRETVWEALAHQDYPFSLMVHHRQKNSKNRHFPLFQSAFVFEKFRRPAAFMERSALNVEMLDIPQQEGLFDVTLEVHDTQTALPAFWKYRTDIFDESTVSRQVGHFLRLLESIVSKPECNIGQFVFLSEAEQHRLSVEWNDTAATYEADVCIHQLFEARVERYPDRVAVVFEKESLTINQLNQKANQLAHALLALGVGPEVPVGICVDRSLEMMIGLLGILKAGGAFVPLDTTYPSKRLAFILDEAEISVLVTRKSLEERLPVSNRRIVCVDAELTAELNGCLDNPDIPVDPEHLAYVLYTSGSTGRPKGVMVSHRSVLNTLFFLESQYPVAQNDVYLLKTNYLFDVSLVELFGWFVGSGHLVILPPQHEKSPKLIASCIKKYGITHVNFVPSMLAVFLREIRQDIQFMEGCPLQYLLVAGEAFSKELVNESVSLFQGIAVENLYGPTEAAIYAARFSCSSDPIESFNTPIGTPISNTKLYVVNRDLQLAPVGVPGELCIAGAGVSRGYINQPALTSEKFVDSPFQPGERLYKTGDLVRYLPDGNIEFLGRIDHQVKIRGFRVELGEIETVLLEYPGVQAAVVLLRETNLHKEILTAYLVTESEEDLDTSDLPKYLRSTLPDYMVPSAYVKLQTFPLMPNGKLDRKALLDMNGTRERKVETLVSPRTQTEKNLSEIWSSIIGIDQIGIHDSFFDIGGNSLALAEVMIDVCKAFQVDVPMRLFFDNTTVADLARAIDTACEERSTVKAGTQHLDFEAEIAEKYKTDSEKKSNIHLFKSPPLQRVFLRTTRALIHPLTRIEVTGEENIPDSGPLIIATNHINWLDVPLLFAMLGKSLSRITARPSFIAQQRWKKLFHWYFTQIGDPRYVRRGQVNRVALNQIVAVLQVGGVAAIAPEGTFDRGKLIKAEAGIAYLATRAPASVLPVVVYGQEKAIQSWKELNRVPVHIRIGKVLQFHSGKATQKQLQKCADDVMIAMTHLLPSEYHGIYGKQK